MNKKMILDKLEDLYNQDEVHNSFSSRQDCVEWGNKVAPLLKFNNQYYVNFIEYAHRLNLNLSANSLNTAFNIMKNQLQMAIEELRLDAGDKESSIELVDSFIDEDRINELKSVLNKNFDLSKLLKFLIEINSSYQREDYFSVIMLVRALIDHIPPIFNQKDFTEVVNNYKGSKSFKESMEHLEKSSRKIADQHLHCQIRTKEVLPNKTQVNFSNDVDVLLAEIVRILK